MKKIIINAYGDSFYAKENISNSHSQNIFVWKNNVHSINKLRLKEEYKTRKLDALKSKKSTIEFLTWKRTFFVYQKSFTKLIKKVNVGLIKKGLMTLEIKNDVVKEQYLNAQIAQEFKLLKAAYNATINKIYAQILHQNLNEYMDKPFILKRIYMRIDHAHIQQLESQLKKFLQKIKHFQNLDSVKVDNKKTKVSTLISWHEFKTIFNVHGNFKKANILLNFYKQKQNHLVKSHTYEYQYQLNRTNISIDYYNNLLKINRQQKDQLLEMKDNFIQFKSHSSKQGLKKSLQQLKHEYKNFKRQSNINLKSNKTSKRAKFIARQKLHNSYSVAVLNKKLVFDKYFKYKNEYKTTKINFSRTLKVLRKRYEAEKDELLKKMPIEISKINYYMLIIIGSIFPSFTAIARKQYFKGCALMLATIIGALILAWSLGAFPSNNGNGIIGLASLGHDPNTQELSNGIIGMTNGLPNDSRFFLVMGVVALILTAMTLGLYVLVVLNNINVCNLLRLGIRNSQFKQQKDLLKNQGLPYLISAPAFIFTIFIVIVPLVATILIAFTNINQRTIYDNTLKVWIVSDGISYPISWVGFKQFNYIFNVIGPEFGRVLQWTLLWTLGSSTTVIAIGTLLAIIVNQSRIRGKTLIRIIYLLPWAIPAFITIMFFSIFFQSKGIFNDLIGNKIFAPDTNWLNDGAKTRVLMILVQGWLGHSYMFLLITGTIQSISPSLYEAAKVDGASAWKQFRSITMPMVVASIAPLLIGQFTFQFNNFGLIYLLNGGGNPPQGKVTGAGEFDIFISWIYKLITDGINSRPGAAAAISLVTSIFTVTPSAFLFLKSKSFSGGNF